MTSKQESNQFEWNKPFFGCHNQKIYILKKCSIAKMIPWLFYELEKCVHSIDFYEKSYLFIISNMLVACII